VSCWWISWKRAQQSMQCQIVQPWKCYEQPLSDNAMDCLLLHNNTRLLVATATQQPLQHFRWTVLEHAPYSSHLVPSDFHSFPLFRIVFLATNMRMMTA
jgi:hypothetical protein